MKTPSFCILCSGRGSNMEALIKARCDGLIHADISAVISNSSIAPALETAARYGINTYSLPEESPAVRDMRLEEIIKTITPDFIVLAGYIKKIPLSIINAYPARIINIHPSLLPEFGGKGMYGLKVHEAVLLAGKTETGLTVHLVAEEFDSGPILFQKKIPVISGDTPPTLAARVLKEENALFPQVIEKFIQDTF